MAAYAALVSVMQILDQLERHPSPPITLEKQQVESLTQIVTFLQEFLAGYDSPFAYSDEADPLEMRIADAAYAVEDVIESYIVDAIQLRLHPSWSSFIHCFRGHNDINRWKKFCQDLQQVTGEMDSIKKEVMDQMKREETGDVQTHQPQKNIFRSSSLAGKNSGIMVGFDGVLLQLLDKLTGGPQCRQVIPITGMGGIGKTTLARHIFAHGLIKEYFHKCAWVTISQQYNTREIICQILSQLIKGHESCKKNDHELREELYQHLFGRKYLIIMDDIWSIDVWEKMKFFLPDNNIGSRIIVTTRLSYLASQLTNSYALGMEFLDEANSWNLFFKTVCGEETRFPLELEEIGKKIVKHCRGLPLSLIVIGGLLAKSQHTQQHWEHIEQNLNSIVNSENDEYCLKILKLSYKNLPVYLKSCFLYMGIFEEDKRIRVSTLIQLWVSEGFLKPENDKSLETVGRGFLKDLIDRNLIMIHRLGCTGNIKYCKMHDLLRDLCLREGGKERFYHVAGKHNPQGIHDNQRRLIYPPITSNIEEPFNVYPQINSNERVDMSRVRSFTYQCHRIACLPNFRLLRILNAYCMHTDDAQLYKLEAMIHKLVNARYLNLALHHALWEGRIPSSGNLLWNLHTILFVGNVVFPVEIWKMSQLRHVYLGKYDAGNREVDSGVCLSDPPCRNNDRSVILENLETLKSVRNFKCADEVVSIIPNIKRLRIIYDKVPKVGKREYCLRNLECLRKLESFSIFMSRARVDGFMQSLTFPISLKKLTLGLSDRDSLGLEKILEKIGSSSPHLQKLEFYRGMFTTGKWETVEGQFPNLKCLKLWACGGLIEWMIEDSSHFPCLEKLLLEGFEQLEEIPAEIGNIPTLQLIELKGCNESVLKSAKKILEEQQELQGEQLSFRVRLQHYDSFRRLLLSYEKLQLVGQHQLEEIPSEIGNIPTLQRIYVEACSESAVKSARKIVEEQEELQGEQPSLNHC